MSLSDFNLIPVNYKSIRDKSSRKGFYKDYTSFRLYIVKNDDADTYDLISTSKNSYVELFLSSDLRNVILTLKLFNEIDKNEH